MNWYARPQAIEALAASYVMGSMSARARRRLEQVMSERAEVAQAVSYWADRAMPLALSLPSHALPVPSWERLAARLALNAPTDEPAAVRPSWWRRWFAPIPVGALAMGLLIGIGLPMAWRVSQIAEPRESGMQLPESYVGVLSTAQGQPGLIVSSLRHGTVVDLKVVTPVPVPAGHRLHLWRIDKTGSATSLGALPVTTQDKFFHLRLSEPAEKAFFSAVELAVSIESGAHSPAAPTQPFVYRGLCGKVWK